MFNHSLPCSNRTWGPNFVAQMFSLKSVHLRELDHALDLQLDSAALTAKSSAQKRNHKNETIKTNLFLCIWVRCMNTCMQINYGAMCVVYIYLCLPPCILHHRNNIAHISCLHKHMIHILYSCHVFSPPVR